MKKITKKVVMPWFKSNKYRVLDIEKISASKWVIWALDSSWICYNFQVNVICCNPYSENTAIIKKYFPCDEKNVNYLATPIILN